MTTIKISGNEILTDNTAGGDGELIFKSTADPSKTITITSNEISSAGGDLVLKSSSGNSVQIDGNVSMSNAGAIYGSVISTNDTSGLIVIPSLNSGTGPTLPGFLPSVGSTNSGTSITGTTQLQADLAALTVLVQNSTNATTTIDPAITTTPLQDEIAALTVLVQNSTNSGTSITGTTQLQADLAALTVTMQNSSSATTSTTIITTSPLQDEVAALTTLVHNNNIDNDEIFLLSGEDTDRVWGTTSDIDFRLVNGSGDLKFQSKSLTSYVDDILTLDSNGNVGINNISPQEKLHVSGNIALSNLAKVGVYSSNYTHGPVLSFNNINTSSCAIRPATSRNGSISYQSNVVDLGSSSYKFRNTYTNELRTGYADGGRYITGDNSTTHPRWYPSTNNYGYNGRVNNRWYYTYTYNLSCAGTFYNTSDDRLKHNEEEIVDALTSINKLKLRKYNKTSEMLDANFNGNLDELGLTHHKEIGFIAQEVAKIPELNFLVSDGGTDERVVKEEDLEAGTPAITEEVEIPFSLNYQGITNLGIQAIQELSVKCDTLESVVNTQQEQINNLLQIVNDLRQNNTSQ